MVLVLWGCALDSNANLRHDEQVTGEEFAICSSSSCVLKRGCGRVCFGYCVFGKWNFSLLTCSVLYQSSMNTRHSTLDTLHILHFTFPLLDFRAALTSLRAPFSSSSFAWRSQATSKAGKQVHTIHKFWFVVCI